MGIHICVTNPSAFKVSIEKGIYGNVGSSKDSEQTFWGKTRDLYAVKPNDLIIFYIKGVQKLSGIYRAKSMPYIYGDNTFGKEDKYPYRFYFDQYKNFPNGVPVFEFYGLVEKGIVSSISSFEKDITAKYRGIRQLYSIEYDQIFNLFRKYNPNSDPDKIEGFSIPAKHKKVEADVFHGDFIKDGKLDLVRISEPLEIIFNSIPQKSNYARYETILQLYINYHLIHNKQNLREEFELERLSEVVIEAPIFHSMQFRTDLLVLYTDNNVNYFHSFIELKRDVKIKIKDLSQLIYYLKSYASSKSLSINSYEGIFISTSFEQEAIDYLEHRSKVEQENIVKLISYEVVNGRVHFKRIV